MFVCGAVWFGVILLRNVIMSLVIHELVFCQKIILITGRVVLVTYFRFLVAFSDCAVVSAGERTYNQKLITSSKLQLIIAQQL